LAAVQLKYIILCKYLGSCTTSVHNPTQAAASKKSVKKNLQSFVKKNKLYFVQDWNANQRNILEDELAKYSTPMYRAPEMLGKNY